MTGRSFSWIALAVALTTLLAAPAFAATAGRGGHIALSLPSGKQGPLVLRPAQVGWSGEFTIGNVGTEPLVVSRVAFRGSEDDVRSPPRLSVRFADGSPTSASIPPGASKDVIVTWTPDKDTRARQAFGNVVVTSTDEASGEVAMGFCSRLPSDLGWIGQHVLSLLVFGPFLAMAIAAGAGLFGRRDDPWVARSCAAVAAVELVLAGWAYAQFDSAFGRVDGNDGFQLVERSVWIRSIGSEWSLGVDGTSVSLVLLAAAAGFVATLVACGERRGGAYLATLALLSAGVTGCVVALDLVVLFAAWTVVWLALALLVGAWGDQRSQPAAGKVALAGAGSSVCLLFAFIALSRASGPSYMVDGATVPHTMSIAELSRTSFAGAASIGGAPFVPVAWVLLFAAVAVASPVVPFHRWLPDALEHGPAASGIVLASTVVALGPYLLVRVGLGAMPEGARWAGASIAIFGALAAVWGALCAMVQRDVRRFVAYTTVSASGIALYGVGALTSEGIAGGVFALFAHGLGAMLVLGCAAALYERSRSCDAVRARGLLAGAPALRALAAVGLAVSLGVPGLAGSWGPLLALLGGFLRYPVMAAVLSAAVVASAAAHVRIGRLLLTGQADPAWREGALGPYGGRLPDAGPSELVALVPAAAVAFVLGVWPSPLLAPISVSAREGATLIEPEH